MDDITVVEVEPQLVLGIRKRGSYKEIATLLPRLYEFAMGKGYRFAGHPMFVCHEISVEEVKRAEAEKNADLEVVAPVSARGEETDECKCYELPGGKMAKIVHRGPYEDMEPTYGRLFEWLRREGKTIVGPIREAYLNDPREVGLEETLTEISAPIG